MYCRISSDPQGLRAGVDRQRADCLQLCARKEWPVGPHYIDNDTSAYSGKNRPEYARMLDDIKNGQIDAVVVYHLDRLHRRPKELEEFAEICQGAGLTNVATVHGDFDIGSDDGLFTARILGAVARKESDDKSRRIKRAHVQMAAQGRHLGGVTTPYGYRYVLEDKGLVPEEAQAPVVREMFERFATGASLKGLAHDLTDRGARGARGGRRWSSSHIGRILDNPTYKGYRHLDGHLTRGEWEPLVSEELWDQVEARRRVSKAEIPAHNRKGKGNALLSGILFCSCGAPMWRSTYRSKEERSSYECAHSATKRRGECHAGGVNARRAEGYVQGAFLERVSAPFEDYVAAAPLEALGATEGPVGDELESQLEAIDRKIERAIELAVDAPGRASERAFNRKLQALEEARAEVEKAIAQRKVDGLDARRRPQDIEDLRKRAADLPAIWNHLTDEEKREALGLFVDRVIVLEGKRPKRFEIRWAAGVLPGS